MRRSYTIEEAQIHLRELIAHVELGHEIELHRGGQPVALLVPIDPQPLLYPERPHPIAGE